MKRIPLEDNVGDVVSKTMRGLRLGDLELAKAAGVSPEAVQAARKNRGTEAVLRALAPHLQLDADALVVMARGGWQPEPVDPGDGFAMFTTDHEGMGVNSYLVWDAATRRAIAFDTGATCEPMLAAAAQRWLKIELILLTHTHDDHIADLDRLAATTGAAVWSSVREPAPRAHTFTEGREFPVGALRIRTLETWGHSEGGTTFVVEGLARRIAVAGDSLFASSMGGAFVSWERARAHNVEKILRLPADTVLACGHGPLTTVGEELAHNPFFAGAARRS